MRIRTSLALMGIAILLPILAAAGFAFHTMQQNERAATLRGVSETARATSLIVDREVNGAISALRVLGNSPYLETRDFKAFYAQAAALNRPDVWTVLLDASGTQVLDTAVPYGTAAPAVSRARVAQVIASQQPLITNVMVGPATGRLSTTLYVPAQAAGGRSFVVAHGFDVGYWKNTAMTADVPADWIVAVIDRDGKFVSRSHKANELLGRPAQPELVAAAASETDGLIRHQTREGIDSYDAFTHSRLTGWTVAVAAPVASIEAAALNPIRLAFAGGLLALIVAVLTAATLGKRFADAVDRASTAAVSVGRGNKPVWQASGIAEVDALNLALVDASELLDQERSSRIAAQAARQRLLDLESRARETAQQENEAKNRFLAMLGHELRNPLAAISGASSALATGRLDPERTTRFVEMIQRQNLHLSRIVDDLLDVSRLVAGKVHLQRQTIDLAKCIRACLEAIEATGRTAGYRIALKLDSAWVEADAVRVEQIVTNLVTNALKFSPPGSEVRVTLLSTPGRVLCTVQDSGAGMAAALLPLVFEPFVQGPPAADRVQTGLGIGLALVRQLVALHGGEVRAASNGVGHGSTFTFWLPSVAAPRKATAPPTASRTGGSPMMASRAA